MCDVVQADHSNKKLPGRQNVIVARTGWWIEITGGGTPSLYYLQRWQVPIVCRLFHRFDEPSPNASPQPYNTFSDVMGHVRVSRGHTFHRPVVVVPEIPISLWIVVKVTIPEVIISHGQDPLLSGNGMTRDSSWDTLAQPLIFE
jgi:hypothetical protein